MCCLLMMLLPFLEEMPMLDDDFAADAEVNDQSYTTDLLDVAGQRTTVIGLSILTMKDVSIHLILC